MSPQETGLVALLVGLVAAVVILALVLTFAAGVLPLTRTAGFHRSTIEG